MVVVGFDVGGPAKGFHGAALDGLEVVGCCARVDVEGAAQFAAAFSPSLIAVDAPRRPAEPGESSRADERRFASQVSPVFFTPHLEALQSSRFYDWVLHGFALYARLEELCPEASLFEAFPSALFSTLCPDLPSRAARSRAALASLGLSGLPDRSSQDARDAVGAAYLGKLYLDGQARRFGEMLAPPA